MAFQRVGLEPFEEQTDVREVLSLVKMEEGQCPTGDEGEVLLRKLGIVLSVDVHVSFITTTLFTQASSVWNRTFDQRLSIMPLLDGGLGVQISKYTLLLTPVLRHCPFSSIKTPMMREKGQH